MDEIENREPQALACVEGIVDEKQEEKNGG
jgi:hypothetical protein